MDSQIDPRIIETNNLLISSDNGVAQVERIFPSSTAKNKCKTEHGTVIVAEMLHGTIPTGEMVTITSEGREITKDVVVRIEEKYSEIKIASASHSVGFCLQKSRLKTIKEALRA
ncbi:MAG: hypothetical protein UV57_C0024G0007 [Parcubacteria group bacterium GW2011_GWD2_43_10]|uniref:Uncharacterized protein n=4 Tax=Candidatus Vebleniibacteriota TaxID=1817921 RepID=A0A1G2QC59_9BACT|nr:MAG: hypothetical protein UV57_C0024G0007 [Parcubacteria group bacterium GW2011_GWD2_43_10]KKS93042.1 MAG: hypothetical protein UV69_C0015G0012 [Parcubacteria group bacterium GW2011_GWE2_43_12]KKT11779.1 MAG: hypothetical protein UV92_C0039G0003 [Parcubacteria group bacterium GW2011_GWA1_43_27]KKT25311.1 MAG: hypothetical protein UW12_C0049G0004 [Parcubacteria group bacterium GW2011_GWF1_43_9]OHA54660.1 MAG: hypothetical protein A2226_01940 [Candidatus Veblenbacteria bacterium RIFOXYA2_FULL_